MPKRWLERIRDWLFGIGLMFALFFVVSGKGKQSIFCHYNITICEVIDRKSEIFVYNRICHILSYFERRIMKGGGLE